LFVPRVEALESLGGGVRIPRDQQRAKACPRFLVTDVPAEGTKPPLPVFTLTTLLLYRNIISVSDDDFHTPSLLDDISEIWRNTVVMLDVFWEARR
jgi:hypothetical protein